MAIPSVGGGRQYGDGNANEVVLGTQGDITSGITTAVTLTPAQIATGIISVNPGAAINLTTPTAVELDAFFSNAHTNSALEFTVINLNGTNAATLVAGTDVATVGALAVALSTSATFRARKTDVGAWVIYRV